MARGRAQGRRKEPRTARRRRVPPAALGALALAGLAALGAAGARGLLDPETWPVRRVQIEGEFRYLSRAALEEAVAPHVTGGFFTVDVARVRAAAEGLAWVERAAVRRVWPDRLTLTVVEREPLARWGEADVISRRGETFRPSAASIPEGLPVLEGPPGRAQALAARYRELERALAPTGLGVRRLAQDARRSLRLELSNGIELRLGGKAVQARLARFVRSYAPALARRAEGIRYVDLRYTNGFAVGWAAGSAPQAPGRG